MSTFRSPDVLTGLFGTAATGTAFRFGTLTAWNSATRTNTVDVNGAQFANCPVLEPAVASLAVGGLLLLLVMDRKHLILGRVVSA